MISHFPFEAHSILFKIYNDILLSGTFSHSWITFLIFFIPKSTPGKFLSRSQRGISRQHSQMLKDLTDSGVPKNITEFIYNSISFKNIYLNINSELVQPRVSTVGLPQGCILSLIINTFYTCKPYQLFPPGCMIFELANNTVIFVIQ